MFIWAGIALEVLQKLYGCKYIILKDGSGPKDIELRAVALLM